MPESLDISSEGQISKEEDDFFHTFEWQNGYDTFATIEGAFLETEKRRMSSEYQCFQGLSPTTGEDDLNLHGESNAVQPQGEALLYVYLSFPAVDL